ncbi:hypothetical protein ACWKSP_22265 [Micromonosporaceae bacterium Da 78-11]
MSTVTIRWHSPDSVTISLDGIPVGSASNDVPGETPLGTALVAATVAEDMARAFGASIIVEGTRTR